MSALAPFTLWLRVVPTRGTSRFTYLRDLQNLSVKVYNALLTNSGTKSAVNMAAPGGGQTQMNTFGDSARTPFNSVPNAFEFNVNSTNQVGASGCAAVPQIGNSPALLMITGFYTVASANPSDNPTNDTTIFCKNEVISGPKGPQPWLGTSGQPTSPSNHSSQNTASDVDTEVTALINAVISAISSIFDSSGATPSVYRISYKNITYGDRGFHLPAGVNQA